MILSYGEADGMIRGLKPIPLSEIGTSEWKTQRDYLEQLNVTAHSNASRKVDDFVASLFVSHEKVHVLLHEMLVMDVFRRNIISHIRKDIVSTPTGQYMYIQYEGVLMNLLECMLFHEDVVTALDEDASELLEYCWRNVADVLTKRGAMHGFFIATLKKRTPQEMLELGDPAAHSDDKVRFTIAMASLSCIWFVVERIRRLPMSVLNCALVKMDLMMSLAEVICQQPWLVREKGKQYKYIENDFKEVSHEDSLVLCSVEAHCWFAVHFLMCDSECRRKYPYTSHRKENIARIRRFLHELLLDQVPMLADVQRALDEMSFLQAPSNTEEKFKAALVIEPVPRVMSAVTAQFGASETAYARVAGEIRQRACDPKAVMADAMMLSRWFEAMFPEGME
eukprot:PhM_4_TR12774/c0_g1_i1/m.66810